MPTTSSLMRPAALADDWRELDHRTGDGLAVTLLWSRARSAIKVAVTDRREGRSFAIDVPPREALRAFHHPFAYSA